MPGRFLIGLIVVGVGVGAGNAAERQSLRPQALFQHGAVLEPEAHGRDRSLVQSGSGNPSFQLQPVFLTFLRLNQEGERPDRVAVPGQTAGDAAYKMGGRADIVGVKGFAFITQTGQLSGPTTPPSPSRCAPAPGPGLSK